jgi:hypothetical protein
MCRHTYEEFTVNDWAAIGYVASALVLTAFGMKSIVPLRLVAMCSNLVFIIYGLGLGLAPIWCVHAVLLPMNAWRLFEAWGAQSVGAHVLRHAGDDLKNVAASLAHIERVGHDTARKH